MVMKRWFGIEIRLVMRHRAGLFGKIALYSIIVLGIFLGGFEATALNVKGIDKSGIPDNRQLEKLSKLDSDSLVRIVRLAGRDQLMFVLKNMDANTLAGILRNMDPDKLARIVRVLADEQFLTNESRNRKLLNRENLPGDTIRQQICETDKNVQAEITPVNIQPPAPEEESLVEIDQSISVIIHPSNPVRELSKPQLRKLFSGDVTNWNQLGGPDLPLKLVATPSNLGVSNSMHPRSLIRTPFRSLVVVGVAETQGAVGLVRTQNERQRSFLTNHSAVKTLGIKTASGQPD
jgi:phosphate transport system substrate-binding protein